MKAQIVLTPTESKKLIAKAIARMSEIETAQRGGMIVMHPSSSTYFLVEELTGKKPDTTVWLCGTIVKKGLCVEWGSYSEFAKKGAEFLARPGSFPHSWIIKGGKLQPEKGIDEICRELGPEDVYVKSGNALDPQGNVGVLIASLAEGTIGKVSVASKKRGFKIIYSMGIEKLIPIPIEKASKVVGSNRTVDYSMGIPCALMAVPGLAVTEVDAFRILAGVEATPIAAGGVGGAEGSVVLLITGESEHVQRAIDLVEGIKGTQLPTVKTPECPECIAPVCKYAGKRKHWC